MSRPTARDRVLQALSDLGGEATPGELVAASSLPPRSVTHALARLREDRLVGGPKNRVRMTSAGRLAAPAQDAPEPAGRFEEAVEAAFGPSPALSAFCRVGADLIVARQLYPERPFHPALLAYGPPGRGETAAAELLAQALGLGGEAIVDVPALARGEVVGRRRQGEAGWAFEPASHLALPFFCLDELGEAEADVRRQAQVLLHGDREVAVEGEKVALCGTAMATWNPRGVPKVIGEAYWRRALALSVEDVEVPDLPIRLRQLEQSGRALGTLPLERYRRVAALLDDGCLAILAKLNEVLTDEGRQRVELRLLELAVLGRAARYELTAGTDLRGVTYFVGSDVLTVVETVEGLVQPDWRVPVDELTARLGDVPGLAELATVAGRRLELRADARAVVAQRRRRAASEDLELTGARAAFIAGLDTVVGTIKLVPAADRPAAAALRAKLRTLRKRAGDTRTTNTLGEIVELARPAIVDARQLHVRIDDERAKKTGEAAREKAERVVADREARDAARRWEDQQKGALLAQRAQVRGLKRLRSELSKLRARQRPHPEGTPAEVLVARHLLREIEVVEEMLETPTLREVVRSLRPSAPPLPTRTRTVAARCFVDRAGQRWRPHDLERWGSIGVVTALDAAIEELDAELGGGHAGLRALPPALGAMPEELGPG